MTILPVQVPAPKVRGQHLDGVLLLDKPSAVTSHRIVKILKKMFNLRMRVGHTGSLDPLATGLLPLMLGEATKFSRYLLEADKAYEVTAKWGTRTNTADAEGEVIATAPVPDSIVEQAQAHFLTLEGDGLQIPSMFSAIKHQGMPLHRYARKGLDIEREARPITVHTLEVTQVDEQGFSLNVRVSKGTYIRNLVDDIGLALGCYAYVTHLRRLGVGHYQAADMVTIETLKAAREESDFTVLQKFLLPIDAPIAHWPCFTVDDDQLLWIHNGRHLPAPEQSSDWVRLYSRTSQRFLGVGEISEGMMVPKRMITRERLFIEG